LVFQVLYWVDASKSRRERVASDLRFMMDKALNEAGITVSFPQRDIHLDSSQPLQIEVSSSSDPK
jgi:small-conductance mechanosensitive channel